VKFSLFVSLAALLLCTGCGAGGGSQVVSNAGLRTANVDTSDALFEPDSLLQVKITMDPAEYEILRQEGRSLPGVFSGCQGDFEYSHFKATVNVDGEVLEEVDIRKKGFLGSLSAGRPSFKLNFDTFQPGRRLESLERMTLNNNQQDPGNTHQCITYKLFRDAGLPAPRCNFARVSMNGEPLGIYTHVESIKEHFLSRNFESDQGNLYEGQFPVADFGEYTKEYFQLKTNEEINDRSDLDTVVNALEADDENLPSLLEQVVDVDEYLSFWAMESITGHWDSATGNANNYFVYNDPASGLFHYIPWGTDGAMQLFHSLAPGTGPLYRYTSIPARLFKLPDYQEKYHQRVLSLLDELWDENALHAEVDRIRDLTGTAEADLAQVRNFIDKHPVRLRDAVAGELEQQERTIVDEPYPCDDSRISAISGSFNKGLGYFEYVDDAGTTITVPAFAAPPEQDAGQGLPGGGVTMTLVGNVDGLTRVAFMTIEASEFGPGEIPFHGFVTTVILIEIGGDQGFSVIGLAGEGSITFDEPPAIGEPPTFHFSGELGLTPDGFGPIDGG
jgi:spore coat protein H